MRHRDGRVLAMSTAHTERSEIWTRGAQTRRAWYIFVPGFTDRRKLSAGPVRRPSWSSSPAETTSQRR